MYNFRTDLALERREIFRKNNNLEEIDGIEIENKEIDPNLKVTKVDITNQNGEQAIGKPIGTYITIDIQKLRLAEEAEIQKSAEILSEELKEIINKHIESKDDILVVGLGNIYVTPDSLGPKVINDIDVTRHIIFTTIYRRKLKTSKCNISWGFRNNRNRNFGNPRRCCKRNKTKIVNCN